MTDTTDGSELHDLFDRATDGIESPALAATALHGARRRRTRRRGAAAAALASGLVVAVVVTVTQVGTSSTLPPSAPASTPTSPATPSVVQQEWDPRKVDDLPAADDSVAPALPEAIDPPESAPALATSPMDAAVVAVELGGTVMLLGVDGSWRSLELPGDYPLVALSPSGTRLAVYRYADDASGLTVHDLATGVSRQLAYPTGYRPWDFTSWQFTDDDTLLLDDYAGGFLVDATTGDAQRVPFPTAFDSAVDDAGEVLESADPTQPSALTDWSFDPARSVSMDRTGRLASLHADAGTVVGTAQFPSPFAVVLADRRSLTPRAVLPIRNPDDNYGKGGLGVLALVDDGTVLLRVSVYGRSGPGFRVAAWDPTSGALSLVASSSVAVEARVAYAEGLLRQGAAGVERASAPAIDPAVTQEIWDPKTVTELPWAETLLPRSLEPTGLASNDLIDPTPAIAVVDTGADLLVWHASGGTSDRAYPEPPMPRVTSIAVSPDGEWLAFAGRGGVWTSAREGDWMRRDYPQALRRSGEFGLGLDISNEGGVIVGNCCTRSWYVDTSGSTRVEGAPYDLAFAPDGAAVGFAFDDLNSGRAVVELVDGVRTSDIESGELQSLNRPAVSDARLAAVRGVGSFSSPRDDTDQNGLIAVDRTTLATTSYLPIRDPRYGYTDGGDMGVLAWLDDVTVLAYVFEGGFDSGTRHLFSWNTQTGDLRRVSELPGSLGLAVASVPGSDS